MACSTPPPRVRCRGVRVGVLLLTQTMIGKLGACAITPHEVRQVNDGDRIAIRNPRPRAEGSIPMIGPTRGGGVPTVFSTLNRSSGRLACAHGVGREPCAGPALPTRSTSGHLVGMHDGDDRLGRAGSAA